ncbi:ankyrin repeat domain-containing protein 12-like isoform X1 [Polyodon spathula]|uniref:ankyrin repeat domain-containing protein 12-like isoform X1 n=1 Tax=Polyodon spathula TaxID=7913 RepID=UPI001B7E831B|nr:ankyrin repeat domain-containing protein 12-like isoform X1 [Polyodon spathula]XP_041102122.1 ankyrin repeat domain-containing protein 12-like isoform X1 [Polyodon spathula]
MAKPGTDRDGTMVEKQSGRKNKEKISAFSKTPKLDRSELLGKEVKQKSSMKRKLPFTVSPTRNEERDSDTDSDPGHTSETWGERVIPPYRTYSEKDGPDKKKVKKETGSKKSAPVSILFGYPLSERKQMALLMQMTARDNSPDSTPNHPSQTTPVQKKIPSTSSRQKDKVNKRNERGETPLHMAAIRGDTKQVKELISLGADVNVKDFAGWTPLHEACNLGYYDVAKVLIAAGAEVNTQGLDDDTPLHDASSSGHRDIVKLLLRHGGNAFQANKCGERPVDVADTEELEQLLKGEMPLSDDEDSSSESEDPLSINPSSVDDNMEDSEGEKDSENKQLTPTKASVSGLDEYEFKDDEEEEDLSKALNNRHILRRELRQREKEEKERSNCIAKQERTDQQNAFKSKKPKPSRVLICSSDSSDDDDAPQERKVSSPTCSLTAAAEDHKTEIRTKKEISLTTEHKEKGKGKKKIKNLSKNKENQELKEDGKENTKMTLFSSAAELETSEWAKEEDSFKMSFSPKDDASVHLYHLPSVKPPKLNHNISDKQSASLKQVCLPPGGSEMSSQTGVVPHDHYTDTDNTIESSTSKGFKHKEKSKHHQKEIGVDEEAEISSPRKEEDLGTCFDSSEGALRKTDKDGKVIKKHKLKHKDKGKDKRRKEHEGGKDKHRHRDCNKEAPRNLEFDREFWKENFFKSDENDELLPGKTETSVTISAEKLSEKSVKEKRSVKEKNLGKEKSKEERDKDKSKKDKKENFSKEEKGKDMSKEEERTDDCAIDRESEDCTHGGVPVKEELAEQPFTEKETEQHDSQEKGIKERTEKMSPVKEKDAEKVDKHSDKEKKIKNEHLFDKTESHDCTERWKEREKTSFSHAPKTHKDSEKQKAVLSLKKPEDNKKNKDKPEKKHEKEKTERERYLDEDKDKEKNTEKKGKPMEKGSDLSKLDRVKEKEKDHDREKKKKEKIKDVTSASNMKVFLDEKKGIVIESSKVSHDKAFSSKDKQKEDVLKTPEKDRREKDREIDRYRDKHKDKTQTNKANKAKTNEVEADKIKSKPSPAAKDTRPKEKRLVNDDLMQTSFERMLSLKDREIEQWHRKHKEKIKQKERERLKHRPGLELSKLKNKEGPKSLPAESYSSKELLRSKSSEVSEAHSREKLLKDPTSKRSFSLDAKHVPSIGKITHGLDNSLTRSPRPESEKAGVISRSVSMVSVASSEDSCQTAVTTPRPVTEYDSDFTLEVSDSQMSFSQSQFVPTARSPIIHERDAESLLDVSHRLKPPLSSKQPLSYLRSISNEDAKTHAADCRKLGEERRYSIATPSNNEHLRLSVVESSLAPTQENQNSFFPVPPSLSSTTSTTEAPAVASEESSYMSVSSCRPSLPASTMPSSNEHSSCVALQSSPLHVSHPETQSEGYHSTDKALEKNNNTQITQDREASQAEKTCEQLSECAKQEGSNHSMNALEMISSQLSLPLLPKASSESSSDTHEAYESTSSFQRLEVPQKIDQDQAPFSEERDTACVHPDEGTQLSTNSKIEEQNVEAVASDLSESVRPYCPNSPEQAIDPSCSIEQQVSNTNRESSVQKPSTCCDVLRNTEETAMETDNDTGRVESKSGIAEQAVVESSGTAQSDKSEYALPKSPAVIEATYSSLEDKAGEHLDAESLEKNLVQEMQDLLKPSPDSATQPHLVPDVKIELVEQMTVDLETADDKLEQQDASQRVTRTQINSQVGMIKAASVGCPQIADTDGDSLASIKAKIRLTEEEDIQVPHPRKRKMSRVPQPVQANPTVLQAKEKTQQSLADVVDSLKLDEIQPYESERANPYYEFLHIRKKIEEKQKVLSSVIPQAPQYYDEYVTFNGSYLLDGNPFSKLCIPTITPPPSLPEPLKEMFKQQEVVRMKLRLQHSIEREKLIVSNEQEVLRVHYRAARILANQTLPFSACTILLDAEVYNMPQDPRTDDSKISVRDRFNARQFMSWLHDVDDKFDKLKTCLLMRQQHEAAALNAVQRLEWQLKLQELDPATYKSISIFEIPEFYVPLVDVNDDFELTPI